MRASGTGGLDVGGEGGNGHRLGLGHSAVDARQGFLDGLAFGVVVPGAAVLEVAPEARQWVTPPPVFDLVGRLVAPRVVSRGVRTDAIGKRLHERRPVAASGALDGPLADDVDGQRVVAVDQHARYPVRQALLRQRLAPGMARAW